MRERADWDAEDVLRKSLRRDLRAARFLCNGRAHLEARDGQVDVVNLFRLARRVRVFKSLLRNFNLKLGEFDFRLVVLERFCKRKLRAYLRKRVARVRRNVEGLRVVAKKGDMRRRNAVGLRTNGHQKVGRLVRIRRNLSRGEIPN